MDRADHLLYLKRVFAMLLQRAESVQLTQNGTVGTNHTSHRRGCVFIKENVYDKVIFVSWMQRSNHNLNLLNCILQMFKGHQTINVKGNVWYGCQIENFISTTVQMMKIKINNRSPNGLQQLEKLIRLYPKTNGLMYTTQSTENKYDKREPTTTTRLWTGT